VTTIRRVPLRAAETRGRTLFPGTDQADQAPK
jgi:hypothetical protein